ncbi:MAG: phosphonate transport system permease protein [Candidatus Aldehydirespiratoraceae bacterium]|jgi:phosphonate transport system permease protein
MTATLPPDQAEAGGSSTPSGRPDRPIGPLVTRVILFIIVVVAFAWGVSGLDASLERLRTAPGDAWAILRLMWPPDFATEIDRGVIGKVLESVYIAWIGTVIAATLSLPLAFLASNNVAPAFIRLPIRQLFNVIRAVPELIVAVVLLGVVPLGAWAGALAIGLHSIGTLGKLSSEEIESASHGPVEAVEACGGTFISRVRWGVLPQVMPQIASYWLFRFEINVRASAVLGMIGAGGVGSELIAQLRFRNFPQVAAVLIVTVVVVVFIDTVSSAIRKRIIAGGSGDDSSRTTAMLRDLVGFRGFSRS